MKKKILAIFGFSFLILYFFLSKDTLDETMTAIKQLSVEYWIYGFVFILLTTFFAGWRYQLLLKKSTFNLPVILLVKDTIISLSLNVYSIIGVGEVYKAKKLIDYGIPIHRSSSLVLLDRAMGMLSLCFVISFLSLFSVYDEFNLSLKDLNFAVIAISALIVVFFFLKKHVMNFLRNKRALSEIVDIMLMDPPIFFATLFVSVVSQLCTVVATYFVGKGLGLELNFLAYLVCVPIAGLMAVLPISIGGLGVREISYVYILAHYGIDKGSAIALGLLQYSFYIGLSFIGLPLLFVGKSKGQLADGGLISK